jgi:hypothetical protein
MARIYLQCDVHLLDALRFRLVLITHLLPRYQGQHELRICHYNRGYLIILVRIDTSVLHFFRALTTVPR